MYVTVLTTHPATLGLDATFCDVLRNAWGGGDITWLADGEAAEFPMPVRPDNHADVWADAQAMDIDLNIVPATNRRKKMLLADMDSTMIRQECIDELAAEAGMGARVADITARAMNGELDFDAALRERVDLLTDLPVDTIQKVIDTRLTLMPGGKTLLATMKTNGAYAALVSGGFTAFTAHIAETLGFDEHRANTLIVDGARLTGTVGTPILGKQAKVDALHDITARLAIGAQDVLAVGDGANDLGMLSLAGMGVALHAKPAVQAHCDIRINHGDLTALLYLQGYEKNAFVV
ncbi:MAG: phosphoserine phosphatase SerB [Pseudomonadota bacterium]